ncbi:MAG: hypothetical protein ABR587_12485 [Candidatus Binatia bacterium]
MKYPTIAVIASGALLLPFHPARANTCLADPATAVSISSTGESETTSSSTSTSTSSTRPDYIDYTFRIGLFPTASLKSLQLQVGWEYFVDELDCTLLPIAGEAAPTVTITPGVRTVTAEFDFGSAGLQQSQRVLLCDLSLWHGDSGWSPIVHIVEARDAGGQLVDATGHVCIDCGKSVPENWGAPPAHDYDTCGLNLCGDAMENGTYSANDALVILKAAVGDDPTYIQRHDVDRSGTITALDALRVLRRGIGLPGALHCAAPPAADCDYGYAPPSTTTTTLTP